jgi:excisionase family DNA binding protein
MTVKDIARRWNVSESWVRRRIRSGELPHYRPGPRTTRLDGFECELWWAEYHFGPKAEPKKKRKRTL